MMPLIETALAFTAAMLAASLVVNGGVQAVLTLGGYRSKTARDMLQSLMHGFRFFYNDPTVVPDAAGRLKGSADNVRRSAETFVNDVMSDPAIHARGTSALGAESPTESAKYVEYVCSQDLVALAYSHAEYARVTSSAGASAEAAPTGDGEAARRGAASDAAEITRLLASSSGPPRSSAPLPLPRDWFEGDPPVYATAQNFEAYVTRWFSTLEATASQAYKRKARQLTVLVAALLVVLLNFDSINLMRSLYGNSGAREAVNDRIASLQSDARASGGQAEHVVQESGDRSSFPIEDVRAGLVALDTPGLGIGWQDSWIVHRFCAVTGKCGPDFPPISKGRLALDVVMWITGLLTSCLFLSFGAPFWYGVLENILNLKNALKATKSPDSDDSSDGTNPPTSAGYAKSESG